MTECISGLICGILNAAYLRLGEEGLLNNFINESPQIQESGLGLPVPAQASTWLHVINNQGMSVRSTRAAAFATAWASKGCRTLHYLASQLIHLPSAKDDAVLGPRFRGTSQGALDFRGSRMMQIWSLHQRRPCADSRKTKQNHANVYSNPEPSPKALHWVMCLKSNRHDTSNTSMWYWYWFFSRKWIETKWQWGIIFVGNKCP